MVMAAVVIIMVGVMAVVMVVIIAAAVIMAPGKGFGKNPEKSFPRRKKGLPSGFPTQKGV